MYNNIKLIITYTRRHPRKSKPSSFRLLPNRLHRLSLTSDGTPQDLRRCTKVNGISSVRTTVTYCPFTCQASAYVVVVAGWATGLKLDSDSVGMEYNTHRNIGITLFALGTIQTVETINDFEFRSKLTWVLVKTLALVDVKMCNALSAQGTMLLSAHGESKLGYKYKLREDE
ncbi:unnamed protein product [Lactuca virosa]|uniref:Uncharacterized protein n=1 Tax=Lactuca virosa TaxID=75947 RepID=A0AAU9PQY3_9ASTR|nr:unnamed protein product [Lactuca virosa]